MSYKGKWELTEQDRSHLSVKWHPLEINIAPDGYAPEWHRGIVYYDDQPVKHPDVLNLIDIFGYFDTDDGTMVYEMVVTYTDGFTLTVEPIVNPLIEVQQMYALDFWFNQASGEDRREMENAPQDSDSQSPLTI